MSKRKVSSQIKLDDVSHWHFDATGNWESEPAAVSLNEVAILQVDTPYINTFKKYLREPHPIQSRK
ncbi:MAG: hypothetical protein FJ267_03405 [Planctomycetes bacterium]|nr:hypothetical protein [Planctomycetota bacterium]